MFTRAIVRKPCEAMIDGISTAGLGLPDYELACCQHADYVTGLEGCGLAVTVLPADLEYPDGTFVEDTAIMLPSGSHLDDRLRHRDRCRSTGRWDFYLPVYLCLDKRCSH